MPKIAATPMIRWKWPTTKYVSCKWNVEHRLARKVRSGRRRRTAKRSRWRTASASGSGSRPPQRAQPVECLDRRRHADGHGQDGEGERRVRAHAAHEHVVAPDHEAEEADAQDGVHHRLVAEDRLAREGGEQLRSHAHAGQDRDVDLGVSEEPEQVLPQQRRAALVAHDLAVDHHQRERRSWCRDCGRAAAGCRPRAARRTPAGREWR